MQTFNAERINSFRGLACVFLVFFHLSGTVTEFRQIDAVMLTEVNVVLSYFRMPAFAFISGLILGITKTSIGTPKFVLNKIHRLLVPYLFVTVILIIGRGAIRSDVGWFDVPYFWLYPYFHMWFLPVSFGFFLFSAMFSQFCDLRKSQGAAIYLFIAYMVSIIPLVPDLPLGINAGINLFPFFAIGILFANQKRGAGTIGIYAIIAVTTSLVTAIEHAYGTEDPWRNIFQSAAVVISFVLMPYVRLLAYLGRYSFTIYLFHASFISIGVRVLPGPALPAALVTFTAAILLPILMEICLRRYAVGFLPLIGQQKPQAVSHRPLEPIEGPTIRLT